MANVIDVKALRRDFLKVAMLANVELAEPDVGVEELPAPHSPPKRLPTGKMAVYVFGYRDLVLKVGKAGPRSNARYTSQHYNAASAPSTLAASLVHRGSEIDTHDIDADSAGDWIRENTSRFNFILDQDAGIMVLTLLEAFLQCRLQPVFEGFASQK